MSSENVVSRPGAPERRSAELFRSRTRESVGEAGLDPPVYPEQEEH